FSRDWSSDVCSSDLERILLATIFLKLWPIAINKNSNCTFSRPVSVNGLNLLLLFSWPNAASASTGLLLLCSSPFSFITISLACCFKKFNLWFTSILLLPVALWHPALKGHPSHFLA